MATPTTPTTLPVGHVWEIPLADGQLEITRPDGVAVVVSGGSYVLTASGLYTARPLGRPRAKPVAVIGLDKVQEVADDADPS